jgi:hypothetical protein
MNKKIIISLLILITSGISQAQFIDNFDKEKIEGWFYFTGDGNTSINFVQKEGYARILVDATKDKYNVWWALIKRDVSKYLDLSKLKDPAYELRVEAKIRVSNAPRRVNFMLNTQRTTDYHEHLMEYDIPDTSGWHIISFITKNFDAVPGDTVYVQLALTDFGIGEFYADLDYYKADIVNVKQAGPDMGEPLPYHPPVADLKIFTNHLNVAQDALINLDFQDVNFGNWQVKENKGYTKVLTINANQWAILRWDFGKFKNLQANGAGILELTTQSVSKGGNYNLSFGEDLGIEFGKVRVIEIMGGEELWDQNKVTYNSLMQGKNYAEVFNTQMIFDTEVMAEPGGKTFITISRPVLQRMLNGTTKGLMIRPLGAIDASFYDSENKTVNNSPKLHFNIKK